MDYNSKYTGEQVEELLDKINGSPEDIATPTGNYPDMTVGKASQADTATRAINADNATKAASATTADRATQATTADKATTADYATTAGQATTAESAKTATNADRATTAEYATTAGVAESAEHATTAESATHADAATKADFATDLSGRNEATAEEFTLRPSAGNKSIRDDSATIKRIKGNSVVWNQMVKNGDFASADNWASNDKNLTTLTIEGGKAVVTSKYAGTGGDPVAIRQILPPSVANHKYFVSLDFSANNTDLTPYFEYYRAFNGFAESMFRDGNTYSSIFTAKESGATVFLLKPQGTKAVGDVWEWDNVMVIDLTQMFGAGNEPDTVEEFRALFPDNYYEYNPGQLVSMTANGLFTNGFNQWDEQWEVGYLNADGTTAGYVQNYIRAKNYIPVISGEKYYAKLPNGVSDAQLYAVDENYNFIKQIYSWINNQFFIPDGAAYIRFYMNYGSEVYNNDICINLSHTGVENGKYEPYWDATKDLSVIQKYFPNGMRSAGSIYDEISFDETTQKWVAIQRVGNVDLGSLSWAYSEHLFSGETVAGFKTSIEDIIFANTATTLPNITVSKYNINTADKVANGYAATETFTGYKAYKTDLSAYFTFTTDASEFKSSLSGVMLNYELAEPIITVIEEPINLSYKVGDFGIEQILSDSFSAPFRADIVYQFNATDRIRENSLNIEKLSKTQKECLLLAGGTMSGQINSQDIKPVEDNTYQLGDSTHKYKNVFSDFFTGNLEGNAKTATDLTGRIEATPEVFTYHPSAGEKSIKDNNAFIRRVKGNSVVWNQLVDNNTLFIGESNGMVISKNEDGSITFNGTASADIFYNLANLSIPIGHKVALTGVDNMSPFTFFLNGGIGNTLASSGILTCSHIGTNGNGWMFLYITANTTFNNVTINPKIHYLTRMFGIGNEPNSIDEFRALYPNSYYPYNPGELRNLDCNGIKTVGFNQWDEQWEVGQISSTTGNVVSGGNKIISQNYIPVLPNTSYFLTLPLPQDDSHGVYYYDGNKNYIGYLWIAKDVNQQLFTTPSNCLFIKFDSWGTTYNNDICINLHHTGYRDGEYEPYKEVTHALPLSQITNGEPLRKAGSVYDEINETHYIKRVGVVDLGSLSWSQNPSYGFYVSIGELSGMQNVTSNEIAANILCTKYITGRAGDIFTQTKTNSIAVSTTHLVVGDLTYNNANDFKSAMSGVMLNYELAEPIVTPIETPIDFNYYVEDFGTEEAMLAENSAPFSADIVYQFNATDQIRNNTHNINKLQKSALIPKGASSQYIRGDGSYGNVLEFTQAIPINDGEYEMPDAIHQFILTPNYYAKSPVELDNTTTVTVYVTPPEDSNYLAEYWFEFAVDDTLPNIEYYQPNNSKAVFRIDGDMMTDAVNILHLISSDGGNKFFGEIRSYSL